MSTSKEIKDGYMSTLQDLTVNSKPLINVLTMIAGENESNSQDIVETIEAHLAKVRLEVKLPVLYLIDCIIKNVGRSYTTNFCQNIVSTFCSVFQVVDEKTRAEMFKLRQTWNDVLPKSKLYALDVQIRQIDPAWPITAPAPTNSIHVNPKFLSGNNVNESKNLMKLEPHALNMQQELLRKQQELLSLQQKKIELELLQTKVRLEEERLKNQLGSVKSHDNVSKSRQNLLLKPEVVRQLSAERESDCDRSLKPSSGSSTISGTGGVHSGSGGTRIAPANCALVAAVRGNHNSSAASATVRDPRLQRHATSASAGGGTSVNNLNNNHHHHDKQTVNLANSSNSNKHSTNSIKMPIVIESPAHRKAAGANAPLHPAASYAAAGAAASVGGVEARFVSNKGSHSSAKFAGNKVSSATATSAFDLGGGARFSPTKSSKAATGRDAKSVSSSSSSSGKKSGGNKSGKLRKKDAKSGSNNNGTTSSGGSSAGNSPSKKMSPLKAIKGGHGSSNGSKSIGSGNHKSSDVAAAVDNYKSGKPFGRRARQSSPPFASSGPGGGGDSKQHRTDSAHLKLIATGEVAGGGDVDLRLHISPSAPPPEKQPRMDPAYIGMDIKNAKVIGVALAAVDEDLRQLPVTSVGGKKRLSTEASESPSAKKSKSEIMDELFGSEDVDLRQLTSSTIVCTTKSPPKQTERMPTPPPPPPPPIISQTETVAPITPKDNSKSKFDALRAKLAEISKSASDSPPPSTATIPSSKVAPSAEPVISSKISEAIEKIISTDDAKGKSPPYMGSPPSLLANKLSRHDDMERRAASPTAAQSRTAALSNISLQSISDEELEVSMVDDYPDRGRVLDRGRPDADDDVVEVGSIGDDRHISKPMRREMMRHPQWRQRWKGPPNSSGMGVGPPPRLEVWQRGPGQMSGVAGGPAWRIPPPPMPPMGSHPMTGMRFPPGVMPPMALPHIVDLESLDMDDEHRSRSPTSVTLRDTVRSIYIDGLDRDIRFYGEMAIVFMNGQEPRRISFEPGARRVIFDETEVLMLNLNSDYAEVPVHGQMHRVRLGTPTRELWVDGQYYEGVFGGKPFDVPLDGRVAQVRLEGPPPQVKIGQHKQLDIVAGRIQLIVDAKNNLPVFLDGTVQHFDIDGQPHRLQFTDALRAVRIDDGDAFLVEFGGLPKSILLGGCKHFIRFSVLPRGIRPGSVNIRDMPITHLTSQSSSDDLGTMANSNHTTPILPSAEELSGVIISADDSQDSKHGDEPTEDGGSVAAINPPPMLNINDLFKQLVATGIVSSGAGGSNSAPTAVSSGPIKSSTHGRKSLIEPHSQRSGSPFEPSTKSSAPQSSRDGRSSAASKPAPEPPVIHLLKVDLRSTESLRKRQSGLVQMLYSGMQCSSCGMRFPPENSKLFSQHLDWHFRQNRRGKKNIRKATSRRWYYSLSDWKNYEEVEDLDDREKSFFESQLAGQQSTAGNDASTDDAVQEAPTVIPSVPADPDTTDAHCVLCEDRFEQFYNGELEEWHLRNAVGVEDVGVFHPSCYADYQAAQEAKEASPSPLTADDSNPQSSADQTTNADAVIPGLELNSADDDVIEQIVIEDDEDKSNTSSQLQLIDEVTSIESDVKVQTDTATGQEGAKAAASGEPQVVEADDDDVIINEVLPERINLDEYKFKGGPIELDEHGLIAGVVVKQEPVEDEFMDAASKNNKTADDLFMEENGTNSGGTSTTANATEETRKDGEDVAMDDENTSDTNKLMDADDMEEPVERAPSPPPPVLASNAMVASIDGNIEVNAPSVMGPTSSAGRIRINISKPIVAPAKDTTAAKDSSSSVASGGTERPAADAKDSATDDVIQVKHIPHPQHTINVMDPVMTSQPLPPGEEPVQLHVKPALIGVHCRKLPPVIRGTELTGLCSIM